MHLFVSQHINDFILISTIILISQIIYASLGFGAGMFAISLFALIYGHLDFFVPLFVLICVPTESFITWRDRKNICFKTVWPFAITTSLFIIIGTWALTELPHKWPLLVLGIIIILLALYFIFFEKKGGFRFKHGLWKYLFASLSGFFGSLYGVGGPPLIIYFKGLGLNKSTIRTMLVTIFFVMSIVRISAYIAFDLITKDLLLSWVILAPAALLGLFLGHKLHHSMSEYSFKKTTSIVLLINGILLVVKNLI